MGYLEQFAPALIMLGVIFIGAYVAPTILTFFDNWKENEKKELDA